MESELKKMRSRTCEWYVKVRGVLGSGKRDVREIEMLGRSFKWTEGLEYEASEKRRETVTKALEVELDEAERKKFRSLTATLKNYMSLDRSDVRYVAKKARIWRIRHTGVGRD